MSTNGGRKAQKWGWQHPRTSTQPITLTDYLTQTRGERVVNHDKLTPEYVSWHDRVSARHRRK